MMEDYKINAGETEVADLKNIIHYHLKNNTIIYCLLITEEEHQYLAYFPFTDNSFEMNFRNSD